ncbi:MAG: M48 family metallopeptidase [Patescibacteria group bacterium]
MTLYTEQRKNIVRTWLLITSFLVLIIGLGWFFSQMYGNPGILYIATGVSVFMSIGSYWWSDKLVLSMYKAKEVTMRDNPELLRIVENLAISAGLPMPRVYIIPESSPNAFATGRNAEHAVVAVTEGLLSRLDRSELEGVLAHELSHIGNKDMLVSTVVVVLVGLISIASDFFMRSMMWGGLRNRDNDRGGNQIQGILLIVGIVLMILSPIIATLIQLAVSRRREFLADASGALLTRYPEGLISALKKISNAEPMKKATEATAHLFFENPFRGDKKNDKTSFLVKLFMTHPPIEERIKALESLRV